MTIPAQLNAAATVVAALMCGAAGSASGRTQLTSLDASGEVFARLSPGEWDAKARAVAYQLEQVARPGDRVIVPALGGLDFHVAFLGCLYAGMIAVPVPNVRVRAGRGGSRTNDRLAAICRDCEPRAVLTSGDGAFPHIGAVRDLSVHQPDAPANWQPPAAALLPDTIALLQYTSGSTADSRGVVLTHRNLMTNRADMRDRGKIGPSTTIVLWLPLFHDMGLGSSVILPLVSEASVVTMEPTTFVREPLVWLRAIAEHGDVFNSAPDFAFHMCVDRTTEAQRRELDLSGWRIAVNGSEPVRATTIDRFADAFAVSGFRRETMRPCYGLAECTLGVTMAEPQSAVIVRSYHRAGLAEGTARRVPAGDDAVDLVGCGSANPSVTLLIVDPTTSAVLPERSVGEAWVASPSNGLGYWNRPVETAETFGAMPAGAQDGTTFVRTGDLGFLDEGEFFITGRIKDVLIVGGENYYPQDAEAVAKTAHLAFTNQVCAAWSLHDEKVGAGVAVVLESDERDDVVLLAAVRAAAIAVARILPTAVVAIAVPRNHIPRTTSGKVRRRECARQVTAGEIPELVRWSTT